MVSDSVLCHAERVGSLKREEPGLGYAGEVRPQRLWKREGRVSFEGNGTKSAGTCGSCPRAGTGYSGRAFLGSRPGEPDCAGRIDPGYGPKRSDHCLFDSCHAAC